MAINIDPRTLAPDITGAFLRGSEQANILKQQRLGSQLQQQKLDAFAGQQQAQQLAGQAIGGQLPQGVTRQQAIGQIFAQNPELATKTLSQLGVQDQSQADEFASFAFDLQNTPFEQRAAKIQARSESLTAQGRDPKDTASLANLNEDQQNQVAETIQLASLTTKERLSLPQPKDTRTTLIKNLEASGLVRGTPEFREAIKAATVKPKQDKDTRTTLVKNLEAAGLVKGTPEFEAAILKSTTKPQTLITTKGQTKEQEELAKLRVSRLSTVQDTADKATALLDNLNQLDAIDVQTGALEPGKAAIAAVIEGFGIDASGIADATTAQAFNAISGRLVNEVLNAATGPQTDQDADRARKTMATLGDTPGAATFKNNSLRAVANRQIEQRDFITNQLDEGKNLTQANKSWREFKRKTPSLSAVIKDSNTGLPMFFYQFKDQARQRRPGITDSEIVNAWRSAHGSK